MPISPLLIVIYKYQKIEKKQINGFETFKFTAQPLKRGLYLAISRSYNLICYGRNLP